MEVGNLEQEIKDKARLSEEEVKALADVVLQAGGVSLTREEKPLAVSPEEIRNPAEAKEEMISPQEAVLALEAGGVAFDLLGLASLTHQLRQSIEGEGVFDFSRRRPARVPVAEDFSSTSLPPGKALVFSFAEIEAKAKLILQELAKYPEEEDLRRRVEAWQKVVTQWRDNLFDFSEEETTDYQKIVEDQKKKLSIPQKGRERSYRQKLEGLLANSGKRQRYSNIFWSEKNASHQARRATDLFLETALAVNAARVLSRLHDPEGKKEGGPLDLLAAREKAVELRKRAEEIRENHTLTKEEKQKQLEELNRELINLLIPIANKVAALFPHNTAWSLSAVLAKEEAVCAGKAEALKFVCRWLGFEGKGVAVFKTLINRTGHSCIELDSFTQTKIVIDGNYSSWHFLRKFSDEDLDRYVDKLIAEGKIPASKREEKIALYKRRRTNSFLIPEQSKVLIYTFTPTGRKAEGDYHPQEYETVRLCPYTGEREIWQTNIPFPHLLTAPDRPREVISSDYYFNLGVLYDEQGEYEKAEQLYLEALRINPNYVEAHYNLGVLYHQGRPEEAEKHYLEALRINPNDVEAHYNLGVLYHQGRPEEAEKHYLEALRINPNYAKAHYNLGVLYYNQEKIPEAITYFEMFVRILEEGGLTGEPRFIDFYRYAKEFLSQHSSV